MRKIAILSTIAMTFVPALAYAQPWAARYTFRGLVERAIDIINSAIIVIIALAIVVFLWGVLKYVIIDNDSKNRAIARSYIVYGIIGIFVMVSVWGLVFLLKRTFF